MKIRILNETFKISDHALQRLRQRGIKIEAIDLLMEYGYMFYAGSRDMAFWLCRKTVERWSTKDNRLRNLKDLALVISPEGTIKTVMHCSKAPKHWEKAA